jgi:hypothetical protein
MVITNITTRHHGTLSTGNAFFCVRQELSEPATQNLTLECEPLDYLYVILLLIQVNKPFSMSHSKSTDRKERKKATRKEISAQLISALGNLKETLGEKRFERRIKKAAKLLTAGFKTKPIKAVKTGSAKTNKNARKVTAIKAVAE